MSRLRGTILLALGTAFLGVTVSVYPKDKTDLKSLVMDLQQRVKNLDARLRNLEGSVNGPEPGAKPDPAAAQPFYQAGRSQEDAKDYRAAVDSFTKAIRLDPSNDPALLHRAYSHLELGQMDEALADVNHSIKVQSNDSRAYAFRAKVYRQRKDYDRALADLQEAVTRDPENADFLVAMGGVDEDKGKFEDAVGAFTRALKIKDTSSTHEKRAEALEGLNKLDDALSDCYVAVKLDRMDAEAFACRARILIHKGQFQNAISDLTEAIRLQPDLPEASKLTSSLRELVDLNDTAKKLNDQQKVTQQASSGQPGPLPSSPAPTPLTAPPPAGPPPTTPQPAPSRAASAIAATAPATPAVTTPAPGKPTPVADKATPAQNSATLPPNRATLAPIRAAASAAQHPAAAPDARKAPAQAPASKAPTSAQIRQVVDLRAKAKDYTQANQFANAIEALNQAIQIEPDSAMAYNARGYVYLRTRQCQLAIQDFTTAIQLRPAYANAYSNRAVTERVCGNPSAADEDLKKAAEIGSAGAKGASVAARR